MRKKMCTIDGKDYIIPSVYGNKIKWNTQKVTAACKDGRIIGACRDTSGKWIIPIETIHPLEISQIRKLMIITVYLKNKPDNFFDDIEHERIVAVYSYLQKTGYIEKFNTKSTRIPYEVVMTGKGLNLATEGKHIDIDWSDIAKNIISIAAILLKIVNVIC